MNLASPDPGCLATIHPKLLYSRLISSCLGSLEWEIIEFRMIIDPKDKEVSINSKEEVERYTWPRGKRIH